jgi:deazaflavin-dependent oxidoreductase (nitroreductase family)
MADKEWVWRTPSWVPGHTELYLTDPAAAHMWDSTRAGVPGVVPTLLLTTTGRRSGEPRHSPLVYGTTGNSYCIIASKGGYPSHPDWYLNLLAQPECDVRVGSGPRRARARQARGDEREQLWELMCGVYPPFDDYKARTDREIPVIVLDLID